MATALKMAKENGHTIRVAQRAEPDPPGHIRKGRKWFAPCEVCGQSVYASLEGAGIYVGGIPLLMTCEEAQHHAQKLFEKNGNQLQRSANDGVDL